MNSGSTTKAFLSNLKEKQIIIIGFLITMIAAFFSEGFYHLDENYQIFEFASYKLGNIGASEMPWELREQMRPTFQPMLVVWLYQFLDVLGLANPFAIALTFRVLVGVASVYVTVLLANAFSPTFKTANGRTMFLLSSFFLWFAVYNHVRFSSETCSALLLFGAIALIEKRKDWNLLFGLKIGILLGFSFLFRFQIAFGIVGLGFYLLFIQKVTFKYLVALVLGFSVVLGFGTFLDSYFFGQFVFTPWNYFAQNILEGKAAQFSADPWWEYFRRFFETGFTPVAILIFVGLAIYLKKEYKGIIFWVFIPFLFFHILISHKEIRFLFPMITVLPFGIVSLYNYVVAKGWLQKLWFSISWKIIIGLNFCLMLYVMVVPANSITKPYAFVYSQIEGPVKLYCYSSDSEYLFKNPLTFFCGKETDPEFIQNFETLEKESESPNYVLLDASDVTELSSPFLGELIYSSTAGYLKWMYTINILNEVHEYRVYKLK